jgi:hypothetical protein
VVKPEPVRIRLPSDPPRPAAERQTGGFGRMSPPPPRTKQAPLPAQKVYGVIDPDTIPF